MSDLVAHLAAAPALRSLLQGGKGVVLGAGRAAAYIRVGGGVLAVTARGVPLMPNGIAVTDAPGPALSLPLHAPVRIEAGGIRAGDLAIRLLGAGLQRWDPTLPSARGVPARTVRDRGRAILRACGVDTDSQPRNMPALLEQALFEALDHGACTSVAGLLGALPKADPKAAAAAAAGLLGRGGGLTPAGDDLLAALAASSVALGPAVGLSGGPLADWVAALCPLDADHRTGALSATLLRLATEGQALEPLHRLLDFRGGDWRPALDRLTRLGHNTGRTYALGAGICALLLAAGHDHRLAQETGEVPTGAIAGRPSHRARAPSRSRSPGRR